MWTSSECVIEITAHRKTTFSEGVEHNKTEVGAYVCHIWYERENEILP